MTFGLYLLLNLVFLLFFGWWLRRLVVRRLEPERILADLETEVQAVIQELNNAGDQNVSLIEDRIASLRTLLQRTDIQIDELETRLKEVEEHRYTALDEGGKDNSAGTRASAPEEEEQAFVIPFGRDARSDTEVDPRQQVLTLHGQGLSSDLIASRTGIAIGEVELIISLGTRPGRQ
ncbi:MAG: hypothetical protein WCY01_12515 [Alkalispirochaeta sp.]|jgi:hypothetical protein